IETLNAVADRGDDHDGDQTGREVGFQVTAQLTVESVGCDEVEDDEVRRVRQAGRQDRVCFGDDRDLMPFTSQQTPEVTSTHLVVICDENARSHAHLPMRLQKKSREVNSSV